jgi:hypothetical protein
MAAALLAVALASALEAQNTDAPRAPRIIGNPASTAPAEPARAAPSAARPPVAPTPSLGLLRPPNAAQLAPLPDERNDAPEEIVVIGQGWRLPDLGSEWRARQQEAARSGRFSATALPLYDPSRPPLHSETFTSGEQRRHGYIELFRLRFGRRSSDPEP